MKKLLLKICIWISPFVIVSAVAFPMFIFLYNIGLGDVLPQFVLAYLFILGWTLSSNPMAAFVYKKQLSKFIKEHQEFIESKRKDFLELLEYKIKFQNTISELELNYDDQVSNSKWELLERDEHILIEYANLDFTEKCMNKLKFCIQYIKHRDELEKELKQLADEMHAFASTFQMKIEDCYDKILELIEIEPEFFDDYYFTLRDGNFEFKHVKIDIKILSKLLNVLENKSYVPGKSLKYTDPKAYQHRQIEKYQGIRLVPDQK